MIHLRQLSACLYRVTGFRQCFQLVGKTDDYREMLETVGWIKTCFPLAASFDLPNALANGEANNTSDNRRVKGCHWKFLASQ